MKWRRGPANEVREPLSLIWKQWAGLAGLVAGVMLWRFQKWWSEGRVDLLAFCFVLSVGYVLNQVRERVIVMDDEVVLVRTFWTRRFPRARVRAVRRSLPGLSARLMLDEGTFGVDLPFGSDQAINRLAELLGVGIEHQDSPD